MCGHHVDLKQRDKNTHLGYVSYFCTSTFFNSFAKDMAVGHTMCGLHKSYITDISTHIFYT